MQAAAELRELIRAREPLIVDGGLATELEARGIDIDHPLWSARVLCETPQAIGQLHADYLAAGADCLITASYQATFPGLESCGMSRQAAAALLLRSVELAREARDAVLANESDRARPLIAASIGPYGAYLHDGSEYRGDYSLSKDELAEFHRERFRLLAQSDADLLACETIPSLLEAEALVSLLREVPCASAWFTFTCRDEGHTAHGESIAQCTTFLDDEPQVVAIGVNCTPPDGVLPLIHTIRRHTRKPIVVYPNSGETWDAQRGRWSGPAPIDRFVENAQQWRQAGASLIGGCCRVGPEHIRRIADRLRGVP